MGIEKIVEDLQKEKAELEQKLDEAKSKGLTFFQKYWYLGWLILAGATGVSVFWGMLQ